jgi:hypothetical protein
LLPIFEGFDENAHFSRIIEVYNSPSSIFSEKSFFDKSIANYNGPKPYSSGIPPFSGTLTYDNFFKDSNNVKNFNIIYRENSFKHDFDASSEINWQIQHPPLYYLITASLYKLIDHNVLMSQVFILRIFSYFLTILGVFFSILAARNLLRKATSLYNRSIKFSFLLYPIIFPMFFSEFARIGNDSLCILINGILVYILSCNPNFIYSAKKSILIGFVLGLGLLTKAFFLPITAAILFFFTFLLFFGQEQRYYRKALVKTIFLISITALIFGGTWYFYKFFLFHNVGLGFESHELSERTGLINGLRENFSIFNLLRGALVPFVSFFWSGTWSLVRLPIELYLPLFFTAFWILYLFIKSDKNKTINYFSNLSVCIFAFIYLGLLWHVLITMALGIVATSPGWYFHILMPFALPMMSIAMNSVINEKLKIKILTTLILYTGIFYLIATWSNLAIFSGCAYKGDNKLINYPSKFVCLDQISTIYKNLGILGYVNFGIFISSVGFLVYAILIFRLFRELAKSHHKRI